MRVLKRTMKCEREVIIVGAGPAGSITAAILARQGRDVLLLDKQDFPRDKPCGDAVTPQAMAILQEEGLKPKIESAIFRGEFYPFKSIRIISPSGHEMVFPLDRNENETNSFISPRFYFDVLIQQYAIEMGAEFRKARVEETIIENDFACGVKICKESAIKDIRSKIIVGADGVNSVIARKLRRENRHVSKHRALALRAYIDNIELYPQEIEFYLYRNILPGYAWIFPTGHNKANIGLGIRLDHYHKRSHKLKAMLKEFLAMPGINKRLKQGWQLSNMAVCPLNFGSQKHLHYSFNGAILVGDAAGFINPLTGGGIYKSLLSGQVGAEVIHKALQRGDISLTGLKEYEELCRSLLLGNLRRSYSLQKLLNYFPFMIDIIVFYWHKNNLLAKALIEKFK